MKKAVIFPILLVFLIFAFAIVSADEINNSTSPGGNETNITNASIASIDMTNFFPDEFKIGDVQFNIQVKNNGNDTINDLGAFVTGKGYSTYDVISIESLEPGNKDYIFVSGHFGEAGNLTLNIKILGKTFYHNITVTDPNNATQKELDDLKKQQDTINLLNNLSAELKSIKQNLTHIEDEISNKKEDNYDVSIVNLDDLREYIKNAQTSILESDANEAGININLAIDEYAYQKSRLDSAKKVSILNRLKENAVLFSAVAGAVIMLFTLYELLKRKSERIVHATSRIVKKRKKKK